MQNNSAVLFYGPVSKDRVGGGESGNKRTLELLAEIGLCVDIVSKPYPKNGQFSSIMYLCALIKIIFIFISKLARVNSGSKIKYVHLSGFYCHLVYHEFLLILISRIFGLTVIYELRAGGVKSAYYSRGFLYRIFFNSAVKLASVILVQGVRYKDFISRLTEVKVFHFPNFVNLENAVTDLKAEKFKDNIKLIYFGRVCDNKGCDVALKTLDLLNASKYSFYLYLVGQYSDEYKVKLDRLIDKLDLWRKVEIIPPVNQSELHTLLGDCDFFIFPSKEPREGQSNSLTEAISAGLIPLVSDAGFNSELVISDSLVCKSNTPQEFKDKLLAFLESGISKDQMSNMLKDNLDTRYSKSIAKESLRAAYDVR